LNQAPILHQTPDKLTLKTSKFSLLFADFTKATWQKRKAEGKKQGLIRACKPKPGLKIIDATAGWGRDAALLGAFGAQVLMLERNPIMAALLREALHRKDDDLDLSLIETDACSYLSSLRPEDYPDVVYIDPMHPERQKSALVKKELQVLQELIGPDLDARSLIECALAHVRGKVVVKWPQKQEPLLKPHSSIEGKTVRFDVYTGVC
jgi:16S rRNA (guanine1516-N2)-methyltransferase